MSDKSTSALAVPFLGVLASLQLIAPTVANTAPVKAGQALHMRGCFCWAARWWGSAWAPPSRSRSQRCAS